MNLAIDLVVYLISHGLIVGYHHEWVLPASRAILSPPLGLHQWPGVDKHTVHWCSKSKWQTEASGGLCGLEWDLGGKVNRSTRLLLWIFASCSHRGVWARLKFMKSLKYMDIYEKVGVCMFSWGVRREHTHSIRFSELSLLTNKDTWVSSLGYSFLWDLMWIICQLGSEFPRMETEP